MGSNEMLVPRRARPLGYDTSDGWWYINYGSIDIFAEGQVSVTSVRLTRKQLKRALEIMDAANGS